MRQHDADNKGCAAVIGVMALGIGLLVVGFAFHFWWPLVAFFAVIAALMLWVALT